VTGDSPPEAGTGLTSEQIRERDGDRCSRVAKEHGGPLDVHHRLPRSGGSDETACNRITLCRKCHAWAHKNPREAMAAGWVVSRSADPAKIPVDHALWPAGPVLLLAGGGIEIWQDGE
jgi:hypothetical protein